MSTTIHEACRNGDLSTVKRLVSENPLLVNEDDEHRWRPIFHAGLKKHEDVVRFLIASGADLAAHDGDVLHYAGEVPNNKPIVELLVKYGALDAHVRPACDHSRQLLAAVFLADEDRVTAMLRTAPELARTADGRGNMPLHHAARNGDLGITKLLVDARADVNATTPRGHTVLYCAGGHGHVDVVEWLLQNGADPSAKFTHDGKDLLEWLAQYPDDQRFDAIVQLLNQHSK